MILGICIAQPLHAQFVDIPDPGFLQSLIEQGVDANNDGRISLQEAESVHMLDLTNQAGLEGPVMHDLTGLTAFINLDTLCCGYNSYTAVDVSACRSLKLLTCDLMSLTSLDLSNCPELQWLQCLDAGLTELDLANNTKLKYLYVSHNQLNELELANHSVLESLQCSNNLFSSLDLRSCTGLKYLNLESNPDLKKVCVWEGFNPELLWIEKDGSPDVYFTSGCNVADLNIPDPAFLQALIDAGVDADGNGKINPAEAEAVKSLDLSHKGIRDLTGIGAFINLQHLDCKHNQMEELDLAGCTLLETLNCKSNRFTTLDLISCPNLVDLNCNSNQLQSLNISSCSKLRVLYCGHNQLTSLDVTGCPDLTDLVCNSNVLTDLDVLSNPLLQILYCSDNQFTYLDLSFNDRIGSRDHDRIDLSIGGMPSLEEVCVWASPFPPEGVIINIEDSPYVRFTDQCSSHESPYVRIPDPNFFQALIEEGVDLSGDGRISYAEAEAIDSLDVSRGNISDLTGIEAFVHLRFLNCLLNDLTHLKLNSLIELEELHCVSNQLVTLQVSALSHLKVISCDGNQLEELDLAGCSSLESLFCDSNKLTGLDLSGCPNLRDFLGGYNKIIRLDVSPCPQLRTLVCYSNPLIELNVSNNPALIDLISNKTSLTSIDLSACESLMYLEFAENQISEIDLSNLGNLKHLHCGYNPLKNIDLQYCPKLEEISCQGVGITILDVSKCKELYSLHCSQNQLNQLDLSDNTNLRYLYCEENQLLSLDITNNLLLRLLRCGYNSLTALDLSRNRNLGIWKFSEGNITINGMPSLEEVCVWTLPFPPEDIIVDTSGSPNVRFSMDCLLNDTIVIIPDTAFMNALLKAGVDRNGDGLISTREAEAVHSLDIRGPYECDPDDGCNGIGNIVSLQGIEAFRFLDTLDCAVNQIDSLDLSALRSLKYLECSFNPLTTLNVSGCELLQYLSCTQLSHHNLKEIDLSQNKKLEYFSCTFNMFDKLDLTPCESLKFADLTFTYVKDLRIAENASLEELVCVYMDLDTLDLSECKGLTKLICSQNFELTNLNLSGCSSLDSLICYNNRYLTHLDLTDNRSLTYIYFGFGNKLEEVCVWTLPFPPDGVTVVPDGSPGITYTMDCSLDGEPVLKATTNMNNGSIEATSSEDGMIYLVLQNTDKNLTRIRSTSLDSLSVRASEPVDIQTGHLQHGIYWLYARDLTDLLSDPVEVSLLGVGTINRTGEIVTIYPNPATGFLIVKFGGIPEGQIEIRSVTGRILFQSEITGEEQKVDVSPYADGVYLICIRSNNKLTVRKFIKN